MRGRERQIHLHCGAQSLAYLGHVGVGSEPGFAGGGMLEVGGGGGEGQVVVGGGGGGVQIVAVGSGVQNVGVGSGVVVGPVVVVDATGRQSMSSWHSGGLMDAMSGAVSAIARAAMPVPIATAMRPMVLVLDIVVTSRTFVQ